MLQQKQIRAIVFDLDGTLYSSRAGLEFQLKPKMVGHAASVLNISEDEARALLGKYRKEYRSSVLGLKEYHDIDPTDFLHAVYSSLDLSKIQLYDGLSELVESLSAITPLYLLTNSNRSHAQSVLKKLEILQFFTCVFSVEDAGFIRKPNKEAYETLLANLKLDARSVLCFDDSYPNLQVAHDLGMYTAMVSNGISEPPKFWEMHRLEEHDAPDFVDVCDHSITNLLHAICSK